MGGHLTISFGDPRRGCANGEHRDFPGSYRAVIRPGGDSNGIKPYDWLCTLSHLEFGFRLVEDVDELRDIERAREGISVAKCGVHREIKDRI